MKRLLASCLLVAGLLGLAGCNQTASEPSAQNPATDSADRQEVMKPAMDDSPSATDSVESSNEVDTNDTPAEKEGSE